MPATIPGGFIVTGNSPIDNRMLVANASARKNTSNYGAANSFHGLLVYQQDTNELYSLLDPSNVTQDSSWQLLSDGGDGNPGGANTQIQFNSGSEFGGSARLTLNASTGATFVSGSLTVEGVNDGLFLIKKGTEEVAKVNSDGVFILSPKSSVPTAVQGGLFLDTNGNFYVGT